MGQHTHALDPQEVIEIINQQELRNFRYGLLLLALAVSTWILGLELVNVVLKGNDYEKPFLIAFVTGSFFSFLLIPDLLKKEDPEELLLEDIDTRPELTRGEVVSLSIQLTLIYYSYNSLMMQALKYTSPASSTVLGSTTSVFTLFIGTYLGIDLLSIKKVGCVLGSSAGVLLVTLFDTASGRGEVEAKNPLLGNCLVIAGAFSYSLYLINMELKTAGRKCDERQIFGFVGVLTFLFGIPLLLLLHMLEIETLEAPPTKRILASIAVNAMFSVTSDYATIWAMLLTSPLVTSLSLTSAIPITVFIDYIIERWLGEVNDGKSFGYFFGIISILALVILINFNALTEEELIEKVIDEVLEESIRQDEMLSPLFSPLLTAIPGGSSPITSPNLGPSRKFLSLTLSPRSSPRASPRTSPKTSPRLVPIEELNGFHLNGKPKSKLYMTENAEEAEMDLSVYNRGHHNYTVKRES